MLAYVMNILAVCVYAWICTSSYKINHILFDFQSKNSKINISWPFHIHWRPHTLWMFKITTIFFIHAHKSFDYVVVSILKWMSAKHRLCVSMQMYFVCAYVIYNNIDVLHIAHTHTHKLTLIMKKRFCFSFGFPHVINLRAHKYKYINSIGIFFEWKQIENMRQFYNGTVHYFGMRYLLNAIWHWN